jgi:transcriptional regulator with XRE-family HTH domain
MYAVMDGEKIEAMRQERGPSRQELAQAAGISMSTLRSVERGHRVRRKTGWKVARVFGVPLIESIEREHDIEIPHTWRL